VSGAAYTDCVCRRSVARAPVAEAVVRWHRARPNKRLKLAARVD